MSPDLDINTHISEHVQVGMNIYLNVTSVYLRNTQIFFLNNFSNIIYWTYIR